MSISSSFLWRFLDDVWDLLPTEDRQLFQAYWKGQLQIGAAIEHRTLELSQSTLMAQIPVYSTDRWNRFQMNEDFCDLFQQVDELTLTLTAPSALSRETAFFDTVKISKPSGQIYHEETIRFFDNSVRQLRYGGIINGTMSIVAGEAFNTNGTAANVTTLKRLTKAGAFAGVRQGMSLVIASPASVAGVYTIASHTDDDYVEITESFPVSTAALVVYEISDRAAEYTSGRDYVVNLANGTIQALDEGRIPPTEILTVRYSHSEYTIDVDYTLDTAKNTVARKAGTTIADGDAVAVSYTYNGTATVPMEGTRASASISTLTDTSQDFSGLLPNRTLTITGGPNAGSYAINAILSPTQIQVAELFPAEQGTDVVYSINAFPHGLRVDSSIASIPVLQDLIDSPTSVLIENVDYRVLNGVLGVRAAFLKSQIGPAADRERQAWAEVTKVNAETPYRNFGVLINFFRENSEAYKLALQGLWYAFWTGSTPNNLQRGMHILLGLPFAKRAGTVTLLDTASGVIHITDPRGQVIIYSIPSGLSPVVAVGDTVPRFESLTTGIQIIDRNNEPGFVTNRLGRAGISKFLTSNATLGSGNSDETRALTLLENHLFLPQILVEAITQSVNVSELVTFLDNMKPQWTQYVFSFAAEEDEEVFVSEDLADVELGLDLTTTISNNQWNQSFQFNNFLVQRATGQVIAGGTQATGNFQDSAVDFAALGIDRFDTVRIATGIFQGYHRVLARISSSVLSLDIPDALIVGATSIDYVVIPSERAVGNDAVHLRRENINLPGTAYSAPSVLNTKSNANIAATSLTADEVTALLLVDIGNVGDEVQVITAADLDVYEIDVASPPVVGAQAHEICSCALKRTDNAGPTVTDAFAI